MMSKIDREEWLEEIKLLTQRQPDENRREAARIATTLALHVPRPRLKAFSDNLIAYFEKPDQPPMTAVLDPLIDDHDISLWTGKFRFQSRKSLETIVEEILVRREYFFKSTSKNPVVIDAGANVGLATYFAIRSCAASKVICFEPSAENHKILMANIENNGFENVEVHLAALGTKNGEASFFMADDAPLAGSLQPRIEDAQRKEHKVKVVRLAPFLQEPIGLLKLDIEGSEADVLEDCENDLKNVENIFCEVHPVVGETPSLLHRVLGVLERAGFMVHVARSPWSEKSHRDRPIIHASRVYSLSVFATRLLPEKR
jgi:FkbM family methyltransferase